MPFFELCSQISEVICDGLSRCCEEPPSGDCVARTESQCNAAIGPFLRAPETGYDADLGREIMEEARTFAACCDPGVLDWLWSRTGAVRVLRGTRGDGDACEIELEPEDISGLLFCTAGLACHLETFVPLSTRCGPISGTGASCLLDTECEDGFFCNVAGTRGSCVARLPDNAPCARFTQCDSLLCYEGQCAERTQQAVYCPGVFQNNIGIER